jgi:nucleotide-binding universal stress UspA family protein
VRAASGPPSPRARVLRGSVVLRKQTVLDPDVIGREREQHARDMSAHARSILVGYDDSETARRALDRAADLVGYGSILTVVSVSENGVPASEAVAHARERLLRRQVPATYLERHGDPALVLVRTADEVGADLVVVGRSRDVTLGTAALGSVATDVVLGSACDVLVVS